MLSTLQCYISVHAERGHRLDLSFLFFLRRKPIILYNSLTLKEMSDFDNYLVTFKEITIIFSILVVIGLLLIISAKQVSVICNINCSFFFFLN